jgi:hypothetical protein
MDSRLDPRVRAQRPPAPLEKLPEPRSVGAPTLLLRRRPPVQTNKHRLSCTVLYSTREADVSLPRAGGADVDADATADGVTRRTHTHADTYYTYVLTRETPAAPSTLPATWGPAARAVVPTLSAAEPYTSGAG